MINKIITFFKKIKHRLFVPRWLEDNLGKLNNDMKQVEENIIKNDRVITKLNDNMKQMEENIIENDRTITHATRLIARIEVKLKQLEKSLKKY